jgi:hypothetical protein
MFHEVLPNIINDHSWRMRQAGHVTCMGEKRNTQFWLKSLKKIHHFEHLDIGRRIILKSHGNRFRGHGLASPGSGL